MRTLEELKKYYAVTLMPELKVLEEQRKKVLNKVIITGSIIVPLAILLSILVKDPIFVIIGVCLVAAATYYFSRTYVSDFKTSVIHKIVHFIDENLRYSKSNHVPQGLFTTSRIFRHRIDRYQGDDFVSGTLDKTKVEFSEVHAQYIIRDSRGRTTYHTIFKGLFFIADFNKAFKGTTVVLPDTAERLFGNIGTMFQSWNKKRGQLVKLEDPEFEKLFVVYGDDQIEARYILSTSLMKRIVDFKKKTGRQIHLSFVGSQIFIAISYTKDLFEPRIFRTLLDFRPIQEYYKDLQTALVIVEDLNLNTRIWTKQ